MLIASMATAIVAAPQAAEPERMNWARKPTGDIRRLSKLRAIVQAQAMGIAIVIQRATSSEIALNDPASNDLNVIDHIDSCNPRAIANPITVAATRAIAWRKVNGRCGRVIMPSTSLR